jgi:solute:Na+ symporter, SSS family
MVSVYILLGLYALMLVAIGIYTSKKTKSLGDFFLGGRNVGGWMTAFAYGTTYFSAVIMIGYAGKIGWGYGLSAVWIGVGNAIIGSLVAWLVLAKRTRNITHALDASTMPDFFMKRFNSKAMKITAALLIFIFLVPYSASVYTGLSYLMESVFHIQFIYCVLGMAVLTGVYLVLGGYKATALSDFFQGIIMLGGIVAVILFVLGNPAVGGLSEGLKKLSELKPAGLTGVVGPPGIVGLLSLVLLTSLGTWGLPHIIHKFYAIRDNKAIVRGTVISTVFAIIIAGGAYFLGIFGRLFLNNTPPLDAAGKVNFDMVMPQVFTQALPEIMLGVLLVLVLSASMSTLSSLVLVSSSAISMDLVGGVFFPKMSQKAVKLLMRIFCGVFVLLSFYIAVGQNQTIITLMSVSWGTLAGAFLGPFLTGLWMKRASKAGAWSGMVAGFVTSMFLSYLALNSIPCFGYKFTPADAPMAGAIAMLVGIVMSFAVTLIFPSKNVFDTSMKAPQNTTAA